MPDFLSMNGSAVVAMAGKECVAIASEHRFGRHGQTIAVDFPKLFPMGPRLILGVSGLITDIQTVAESMKAEVNLYELSGKRKIKPSTLTGTLSSLLFQNRFAPCYVESVVAGLEPKTYHPYLASLDLFGSKIVRNDFAVAGTCRRQLYGMCETLWIPDMEPQSLFETTSQALMNACDRDAISGWGATVYVIEKDMLTVRTLKTRMD